MAAKIRGIWLLVCLLPVALYAQQTVRVTGQVFVRAYADGKDTLETLPYASFALLEGKSSTLVKGRTADAQGRFSFTFTVRADTPYYILKVSYIGTKPEYRRIDPRKAENRLGNIVLADGVELAEVVVTAPMKEVELADDTTVINASAYKTPEGSNLEELVKRIPGLEYDSQNKSLTYNGLPIAEINVNGEAFFAGNHALALENLPADVVSRIKVYDKRSKMEQFTGVRSGNENYVLDLQTRKEFNGTLMASAAAGAGNNRKKEAELTGNYFKAGGENLSLIAKSGNRNMTTSYKDNRADNIALNFVKKFGPSLSVNGNIMYNNSINGSEGTSYYEQYLNAGNTYRYSSNTSRMENRMASAALGVQWYADDKTLLSFSGNFNTSKSSGENGNCQNTYSADPGLDVSDPFGEGAEEGVAEGIRINAIDMSSVSNSRNSQYMLMAEATRKLNDKGSHISLTVQYSDGRNDNDNFSVSSTTYYQLDGYMGGDSVLYRNQYQHSPMRNRSLAAGLSFTQPLGKRLKMQLSYKFQSDRQYSNRDTYDLSPFFGEDNGDRPAGYLPDNYETGYTDSLSNRSASRSISHMMGLTLNYADKEWDIRAGVSVSPERQSLDQTTGMLQADTVRQSCNYSPNLTVAWRRKQTRVQLTYRGETRQPALGDLLTLTDNSDPLDITRGNPYLRPSFNQNIRLEARNTKIGLSGDLNWSNAINNITRAVTYNAVTGGRESYPANINGNWNSRANLRYQKRFKRRFNIAARTGAMFAQSVSLVNEGQKEQPDRSTTRNRSLHANLRVGYQPQWGGFDLTGDWRFRHSTNLLRKIGDYTRDYRFGLNAYADLPGGIQLRSDAAYSFRNGTNIRKGADDQVVWNVRMAWRFLKQKKAELSFYWSDILSQKKNFTRSVSSAGLSERHTQQIGSYFIVTYKYRFNRQL